jgi:hypothetical protein
MAYGAAELVQDRIIISHEFRNCDLLPRLAGARAIAAMPLLAVAMAVGLGLAPAAQHPATTPTLSFVSKAALRMVDPRPRGGSTPKKSFEGGTVVR